MVYDPNQKHPKIVYDGVYPNLFVTQRADGSQEIRSMEPGKESYFTIEPSGNYQGHGPNGENVIVSVGKTHEYKADGHSLTTDGHSDVKISGTSRVNIDGSSSAETAGAENKSVGENSVNVSKGSTFQSSSSGDSYISTKGDKVSSHEGDKHENITGDVVMQITGNKLELLSGEYGLHLSSGNMDTQLDSGSYRLKVSQNIIIESTTSITLKCGSSNILIEPSKITITTSEVDIVKA